MALHNWPSRESPWLAYGNPRGALAKGGYHRPFAFGEDSSAFSYVTQASLPAGVHPCPSGKIDPAKCVVGPVRSGYDSPSVRLLSRMGLHVSATPAQCQALCCAMRGCFQWVFGRGVPNGP